MKASPGCEDVLGCCGWYQLGEALPGLVRDPGQVWRAGVSSQQRTEALLRLHPTLCKPLFLSQPEVTWAEKISGLPEQLIHPMVYSLLTPFLRIPTAQAAQMQAG